MSVAPMGPMDVDGRQLPPPPRTRQDESDEEGEDARWPLCRRLLGDDQWMPDDQRIDDAAAAHDGIISLVTTFARFTRFDGESENEDDMDATEELETLWAKGDILLQEAFDLPAFDSIRTLELNDALELFRGITDAVEAYFQSQDLAPKDSGSDKAYEATSVEELLGVESEWRADLYEKTRKTVPALKAVLTPAELDRRLEDVENPHERLAMALEQVQLTSDLASHYALSSGYLLRLLKRQLGHGVVNSKLQSRYGTSAQTTIDQLGSSNVA